MIRLEIKNVNANDNFIAEDFAQLRNVFGVWLHLATERAILFKGGSMRYVFKLKLPTFGMFKTETEQERKIREDEWRDHIWATL